MKYPRALYTKDQRQWCEHYERITTFEVLMDDYEAGHESFEQAARRSKHWFEDWSTDAHLSCADGPHGAGIPGSEFFEVKKPRPAGRCTAVPKCADQMKKRM